MGAKQLNDHTAARRERNSDGNQLGSDAVMSGMAAAGIGLALLHQDIEHTRAMADRLVTDGSTMDESRDATTRGTESEHHAAIQPAVGDGNAVAHSGQSAAASRTSSNETPQAAAVEHASIGGGDSGSDMAAAELLPLQQHEMAMQPATPANAAASSGSSSSLGHDPISDISSGLSATGAGLQQHVSETAASVTHSVDALVSGVTESLSSLTSQSSSSLSANAIGDAVHAGVQAPLAPVSDMVGGISETLLGAAPAPVPMDPIFHGVLGSANGQGPSQFAHDVVDTGGLASVADVAHSFDLGFLGQSYTELADHTLTGAPGMGHGLL
ncbi:MAG: hypothetical protein NT113_20755 [Hyphomicrobiales bacterium]|nr:hypothetical protein [Hyphomicrobiales bacterium]